MPALQAWDRHKALILNGNEIALEIAFLRFKPRRSRNERLSAATPQESIHEIIEQLVSWNRSNVHNMKARLAKLDHGNLLRRNIIYDSRSFMFASNFISFGISPGEGNKLQFEETFMAASTQRME